MGRIYSGIVANKTDMSRTEADIHFYHCIDYLRQAAMCSADLALEPHLITDADDNGPGDGSWNGMHGRQFVPSRHTVGTSKPMFVNFKERDLTDVLPVCKNHNQVIKYVDRKFKQRTSLNRQQSDTESQDKSRKEFV